LFLIVDEGGTPAMSSFEFTLDVFLRKVNELNDIIVGVVMFVLRKIDIDESRKHLEGLFDPIGHTTVEVFGEDAGEGGIEFRLFGPGAIEFKDTAAEIGGEGEINEGDLVFEIHLALLSTRR
jgi:hypothetical protein